MCLDQLESHTISSRLINLKNIYPDRNKIRNKDLTDDSKNNRKGLIMPSNDVITICKTTEKVL